MSIQDLIANVADKLTPTERRIAESVLNDPTLLAFGTVSDLAQRAGTSRPSIVRFATKLGFGGYSDLQGWIRDGVSRQLSSPSQRIRSPLGSTASNRLAIEESVGRAFAAFDADRLSVLAKPIAEARSVWILSGETSLAGANVLHSGLAMARPDVHLVEEHAVGRSLSSATESDVTVVFDFSRYRRHSITTARAFTELGVPVIAITDGPLSPLASLTSMWCELSIPAVGPFDSSVPAVIAAELIVVEVVGLLGDRARERIDRLESMWQAAGTFLNYSPRTNRSLDPDIREDQRPGGMD